MHKILNHFLNSLKVNFDNERIKSVILYGSCAVEDCSKKFPNINIIVVIKDLKAEDLKKAGKLSKNFAKFAHDLPLFMDYDEWVDSSDVYAIEYSDIKDRYRILYGENIVDNLKVEPKDLRFQCEQETKNLLIRLRQTYLVNVDSKRILRNLILKTAKTFMVIFRTVLRLSNTAVPKTHKEVIKAFAEKVKKDGVEFNSELFLKIAEFKENKHLIKDKDYDDVIQHLINTTNSVLKYVDKFDINK